MRYILALLAAMPLSAEAQGARSAATTDRDGVSASGEPSEDRRVPPAADGTFPNFGTDSGDFALDGECDDPRFTADRGPDAVLLSEDRFTDATDCRAAYENGSAEIAYGEFDGTDAAPDFGADSGRYTNDAECDDPRFTGPGMTATILLEDDVRADATDCREAWERGDLLWRTE